MNKPANRLDAYFEQADSWARDQRDALYRSRKIAWTVAIIAALVALLLAIALALLVPLKSVEPLTLLVDRQTGYVQALKPLDPQLVSADSALTQSFLVQYVIAREGYDADSVQSDYRKVGLWSSGEARSGYIARMQASNADSPLAQLPRSSTVNVIIKSVTNMSRNVAMVRFITRRQDRGVYVQPERHWVAIVRYGYSGAPMSVADRLINPLGFQVSRYRRSIEMLPAPDALPTTPDSGTYPRAIVQPLTR